MKNNEEETIKFSELFKELKTSFQDLTKARIAYNRAISKETVTKTVQKAKDSIYTASKNFGLRLEENAKKYEETNKEINDIIVEYEDSINFLQSNYGKISQQNQLKLTELTGKKDEILAEIALLKEQKQKYIEENTPEITEKLKPVKNEQKEMQEKAINALNQGNYEEAKKFIDLCENLKTKESEIEKPFETDLEEFSKQRKILREDYFNCKNQINNLKSFATQLEDDFNLFCNSSLERKENLLAKVENNKLFDRIKGFLSRSVLNKINNVQKFKKEYLDPTKENVKEFTKQLPQKSNELKQRFQSGLSNILGKGRQTLEYIKDKSIEIKDSTVEKINDGKAIVSDKIQDVREGIDYTKDVISGKISQKIDYAYELGKNAKSKARSCAINQLENAANKFNQKAQELRNKEEQINNKSEKTNAEQELF